MYARPLLTYFCFLLLVDREGNLKAEAYTQTCTELANFIVKTAKENGNHKLIMPAFGVGVYITKVLEKEKPTAIEIMYRAFAKAAKDHEMHVNWIVWDRERSPTLKQENLDKIKGEDNSFINNIPHADMLKYAAEEVKKGLRCAILNAGSDRTVGGKFTATNPTTVEEQLVHKSPLIFLQTVFNQHMIAQFKKDMLQSKQITQTLSNNSLLKPAPNNDEIVTLVVPEKEKNQSFGLGQSK